MRQHILRIVTILIVVTMAGATVVAQTPTFQPLMTGHRVVAAQSVGGSVFAGMPKGGVLEWDQTTSEVIRLLTRNEGLGGHFVTSMAWTGENLWIATADGGLTAIADPGGSNESMQRYSSLLPSLDVTAVSGLMVGNTERVYYGTDGNGIGEIVGGLPGAYFDTQNGLIDDTIDLLAVAESIVLIATPTGISRFGANTFSNYPYDDPDTDAPEDLELGPDGDILAAMVDGIYRWDDDARDWVHVHGAAHYYDLAVDGDKVLALAWNGVLELVDGTGSTSPLPPAPPGQQFVAAAIAASGGDAWVAGMLRTEGNVPLGSLASSPTIAPVGSTVALRAINALQVGVAGGFDGVAIDNLNRPWLGDREGDGLGSFDGSVWYNAVERATVDNGFQGLFDYGGGLLSIARDGPALWFNQFTRGIIRFIPAEEPGGLEDWLLLEPDNSPIMGDGFLNLAVHPDGVILAGTDNSTFGGTDNSALGVDVLIDQNRPQDELSWLHLYPATLGSNVIGAITVERRDVIWFVVRNVGLRRWDVNGLGSGPSEPLTWLDTSDDHWSDPILTMPGSELELDKGNAVAIAPDGSIFVGGQGLVQFTFQPILDLVTPVGEWTQKDSAVQPGLLGQTVSGLGFDHNNALWVLSEGGLNRMRFTEDRIAFDAFTDLASYLTFDSSYYSPGVIVPLPGGEYRDLGMAADGRSLAISSDLGGALVRIPAATVDVPAGDLSKAYLFPNPYPGEDMAGNLGIGGIDIDDEKQVSVEILNLVGQVVYRSRDLDSGDQIWDGLNRQGNRVASGLYVVKLRFGGETVVRTLAVAY